MTADARVLIGPANSASQAYEWARALRAAGVAAESLALRRRPGIPFVLPAPNRIYADRWLPYPRFTSARGRLRRAKRVLPRYTHVALDGFASILGPARAELGQSELAQLSASATRTVLIAHGSDIRDPELHMARLPDSYFADMGPDDRAALVARTARNRALHARSGLSLLVSTADLLLDAPDAHWLPVSIQAAEWMAPPRRFTRRPRVLHVPSDSAIKGSAVIDPVLRDFADRGVIDYVRAEHVDRDTMRTLVTGSDLVVDQVRSGFYGVAAAEAMAAGCVVVGYVAPDVRSLMPEEVPIVDAPAAIFAERFQQLLDDRSSWPERARAGVEYAHRWHDGRESARVLMTSFGLSAGRA